MKKIMAILGILCVFVGGGLIVGGFAANGWKSFEPTYEKKIYQSSPAELNGVNVQTEMISVVVEEGEDEQLTVEYYVNERIGITIKEEEGVLNIVEKSSDLGRLQWIYRFAKQPVMRITLPKQNADSDLALEMKSYTSNYVVSGKFGAARIECKAGNVKLSDATFANLEVNATTGNLNAENVRADNIRVFTSTGNLNLTNVASDDFYAKCTTGNLKVNSITTNNFTFEATTGNVKCYDVDAQKTRIDLTTGNLKGTFVGKVSDYTIQLSSSTGHVSPANRVSENGRYITVTTTTGNVDILFAND